MKNLKKVLLLTGIIIFPVALVSAQTDKKPGGDWNVEHYVDEFGDSTADTYYVTSPKAGAYFNTVLGTRVNGRVRVFVDGNTLRLIFIYSDGRPRVWIGETYSLSIKDTVTGDVVYKAMCTKVDSSNLFFLIDTSLREALYSPHKLHFVL